LSVRLLYILLPEIPTSDFHEQQHVQITAISIVVSFLSKMEIASAEDLIRLFESRRAKIPFENASLPMPESLCRLAWEKITNEVFDAGNYVQLCMLATDDEGEENEDSGESQQVDEASEEVASGGEADGASTETEADEFFCYPEAGPFPNSMPRLVAASDMKAYETVFLIDPMWYVRSLSVLCT
jgi:hypothetical protein